MSEISIAQSHSILQLQSLLDLQVRRDRTCQLSGFAIAFGLLIRCTKLEVALKLLAEWLILVLFSLRLASVTIFKKFRVYLVLYSDSFGSLEVERLCNRHFLIASVTLI